MAQLKVLWKFIYGFKYGYFRDTWLNQSCQCPTLDFALHHILMFMSGIFGLSSVLCIESLKGLFPFPLFLHCSHTHTLSLSLKTNKKEEERF